uniref:Reverse transcriptase domain-containing protein n=1 Tax=Tanacetum cinerariifolium TaxID=118510 RepID=A0A6L2N4L6_TANCI|nr:hypothetical protein [Tanacetum cinerariifolium]
MGDKHLDTILEKESDEFLKSSVENLIPNPSKLKDLPILKMSSFSDEDVPKEIYSNPLFDEEIISIKIDLHHFNAGSDLIESFLNHDSLIFSSSKIDSLLDEFVSELIFLKSIPPRIDEADCDPEKEIRLIKKLFDSLMEEIDLSLSSDDSMPSGIKNDDYDSEGDILFLEELLSNDSLSLSENESFHFDIPSSPRPPAKPPDEDGIYFDDEPVMGILTVNVVGDISEHYVLLPRLLPTQTTLCSVINTLLLFSSENKDKVHLLSH